MESNGDDHAGAAERVEVMPVIREWLRRLWGTFRKTPEDAVMEEELRLHSRWSRPTCSAAAA